MQAFSFIKLQKLYEIRVTLSADSRGRSSLDGLGIARFFFAPAPARWRRRFAPAERDVNTEPELTFRSTTLRLPISWRAMAASLNTMTAASVTKSSNWPRESCQFHAVRTGVPSERAKYWRRRPPKGVKPCQSRVLIICPLKHEIKKKVAKYMLFVKNCEIRFCEVVRGRNLQKRASRISLSHSFVWGRSRSQCF